MRTTTGVLGVGLLASTCWVAQRDADADHEALVRVVASTELGQRALGHAAALVALGPRHTGSPGWRAALDYIEGQLRALGVDVHRDVWTDPDEGVEFANIVATIPGSRAEKIVLGAHHDTKNCTGHDDPAHNFEFVGANDSGSGIGLLLALAEELHDQPRRATLELVFFDGEESLPFKWDIDRALFGSRRYVRTYQDRVAADPANEPPIRALVLLDMVGARDLQIDRETKSTPALHDIFERAAAACGHQDVFFTHSLAVTDDHVPFLDAGIPAIDLIDITDNPEWHTPRDTLETLSAASFQAVGAVVLTALPAIESRYLRPASGEDPR